MIRSHQIIVESGAVVDTEDLKIRLLNMGFERVGQVEGPGQFAVRGGIIDIYNMSDDCPYRIELWDDEVDSIRSFDVESQRSIEQVETLTIYPASEFVFTKEILNAGVDKIRRARDEGVKKFLKDKNNDAAPPSEPDDRRAFGRDRGNLRLYKY